MSKVKDTEIKRLSVPKGMLIADLKKACQRIVKPKPSPKSS